MKSLALHQHYRKVGNSNYHLPLIHKPAPKETQKENHSKLDVSFQLIGHYQKPQSLPKGLGSRHNSKKSHKLATYRLRTESVSNSINKQLTKNKSLIEYENNSNIEDITIENFKKNVKTNKEFIQRQIRKRILAKSRQAKQNQEVQEKLVNHSQKRRRAVTQNDVIFEDIKSIIKSKMMSNQKTEEDESINLARMHQLIKLAKLNRNMKKLIPNKSINDIKKNVIEQAKQNANLVPLKDQNNYHQWRKVQIKSGCESPSYRQSNFDIQSKRLQQFIIKNQISLSSYFEFRKELQKFHRITKIQTQIQ